MGGRKKKDSRSKTAPDPQLVPTRPLGRLWDTLRGRSPSNSDKRSSNTPDQLVVTSSSRSLTVPASVLARPHSSYSDLSALQAHGSSHYDSPPTAAGVDVNIVPFGGHGSPSSSMSGSAPFVPISKGPSASYGVCHNSTPDQPTVITSSQSLAVHSSYSYSTTLPAYRPSLHDLSSPTDAGGYPCSAQSSSTISVSATIVQISHSQSESIARENPTPSSTYGTNITTSSCQAQASAKIVVQAAAPPQTKSASQVWVKALELAEKKLNKNNLPPLNLTNLTSQSAEENIEAVVKALNAVQEDDKKKRWSYTWRGKEVVVVERLGTILRNVGQYTKVVDTAIQSNPQVSALVWAGVLVIMQVALNHVEAIEGFEVAIAALLEKMSICEFYAGIYVGVPLTSGSAANSLQRQSMLESALPELYAAVIVFAVKARTYFEARGLKKVTNTLKSFDIEFQPFIEDINGKERVIRECADAATMEKIRNIEGVLQDITSELKPLAKLNEISTTATHTLKVTEEIRNNTQDISTTATHTLKVVEEIRNNTQDISTTATHTLNVTEEIRNNTQDDRILELLTMLTPLEPLKRHQDVKTPRTKNAAAWLLSSEPFCNWRDSNNIPVEDCIRVFCCYGIPGSGKTVISSVVIDELYAQFHEYPSIGIACLYADYKDQNNQILVHILGSFLRQLLTTAQETIPKELIDMLAKIKQQGRKVATEDILALLRIRLQQLKRAFICIDAVDELEPKVQQQLLDVLEELGTNYNTCFFITGREHIENEVKKRLQAMQQHKIVISATRQDMEEFLRQQIRDDLDTDAMDEALQKDVIDAIIGKSQGMFLLPALHIKMVLGMTTKSKRRKALETLPTDLYDSYKGVITRIRESLSESQAELGMRVLMWLHFAYRPLKLAELQHALAVEKGDTEFDAENIPSRKALLDCCLGLVIVDEETLTVRFVHYTLEEYFRKYAGTEFPDGHSSIAESCLTYLNFTNLRQHCMDNNSLNAKRKEYSFLDYASLYWGTYYKHQCNDGLRKLANMILNHKRNCPPCYIQLVYFNIQLVWMDKLAQRFSGPHLAAYFGLTENMAYLCEMGWNIEQKDDSDRTPLSWAAEKGHEDVVRLLIERDDVNINARDKVGRTPLSFAAANGHEAVVGLLIERDDVDINCKTNLRRTPLVFAAEKGHEAVVRLLVERNDVDINSKNYYEQTPLTFAAMEGHEAVVRLLIERDDVDINAKDNRGQTPLSLAAENGHEDVVRLLVERDDIDINSKDRDGQTPLTLAAFFRREAVVRQLIERDDVDINVKDKHEQTPLSLAAKKGHEAIVRLLIERDDVDINAKDEHGQTPLSFAAANGHEAVVRLLIERDVDINAKDKNGRTPLSWAAKKGHEAIVRLLNGQRDV